MSEIDILKTHTKWSGINKTSVSASMLFIDKFMARINPSRQKWYFRGVFWFAVLLTAADTVAQDVTIYSEDESIEPIVGVGIRSDTVTWYAESPSKPVLWDIGFVGEIHRVDPELSLVVSRYLDPNPFYPGHLGYLVVYWDSDIAPVKYTVLPLGQALGFGECKRVNEDILEIECWFHEYEYAKTWMGETVEWRGAGTIRVDLRRINEAQESNHLLANGYFRTIARLKLFPRDVKK